ncbi:glycoside hydrolase family 3 N-terminal domain-containing protein [Chitinilyticum litopenaei]|uniref:glycoside hydrolase family 3 N-terminal domain-containing protein n=1 Tax=Chitinilyticum litopenaei TaxID=1121276 RepID=UPI00042711D0|nr:glycoside hydrolase family 3 N-terminal domain-containing protein [Chitinilyticum litopenaei]
MRQPPSLHRTLLASLALLAACALLLLASQWDLPGLVGWRGHALPATLLAAGLLTVLPLWRRWPLRGLISPIALVALILSGSWLAQHSWSRHQVMRAPAETARQLGQHVIAGYTDEAELRELIARGLIGGVFITRRNIDGMDAGQIRTLIAGWQALRREHGLPPLVIATDQEGGLVSRLSPPLDFQPALGKVLADSQDAEKAAEQYGAQQGRGLAQLGITLNFAPVVDLDHGIRNPDDRYSKISQRALASTPAAVSSAAAAYCRGLRQQGVQCTLKHFPGLGRVFEDTHADSASITTPLAELERSDLHAFRTLMDKGAVTMLAHARLTALDATLPASSSPAVIGMLRRDWGYQGLLITDDLSMAGAREAPGGIEAGAVSALNSGVDWLLVAWDPALVYPVLAALLDAQEAGSLDAVQLHNSGQRLQQLPPRR